MTEKAINLWDVSNQLTEDEKRIQKRYAKQIAKSITSRTSDPKDIRILMDIAMSPRMEVVRAFAIIEMKGGK